MNVPKNSFNPIVVVSQEQLVELIQDAIKPLLANRKRTKSTADSEFKNSGMETSLIEMELSGAGEDLYSSKEAASFLGISISALKQYKNRKKINYIQSVYKGRIFYTKADLLLFLEKNKKRCYY